MSFSSHDRPKLRWPLETDQFEHEGAKYLVLRDQHGIAAEPALIPVACVPIVSRFDGLLTIEEIAAQGASVGLSGEFVAQLAQELSTLGFLETETTILQWQKLQEDFAALPVRPPSLAGTVYSLEPEQLKLELAKFIGQANTKVEASEEIVGVMSPHIDYARGGRTYGSAYAALEAAKRPDVIILIGTSHFGGESTFQMSRKNFASPLGVLPAATQVIADIASRYGETRAFRDEYYHKREHSLELQLPFLTYRFQNETMPAIVPILVGSFHKFLVAEKSPLEDPETLDFVSALAESVKVLRLSGKRVLFYGGVDLAHMGKHFGDKEQLSMTGLPEIEKRDRLLLDTLIAADEGRLFAHMAEDCDRRRICGFPSLYTIFAAARLASMELRGHLLEYRQAANPATDCIVTFASMHWTQSK